MDESPARQLDLAIRELRRLLRERSGDAELAAALTEIGDELDSVSRALASRAAHRLPEEQLALSR
jgi:hypothetical protein